MQNVESNVTSCICHGLKICTLTNQSACEVLDRLRHAHSDWSYQCANSKPMQEVWYVTLQVYIWCTYMYSLPTFVTLSLCYKSWVVHNYSANTCRPFELAWPIIIHYLVIIFMYCNWTIVAMFKISKCLLPPTHSRPVYNSEIIYFVRTNNFTVEIAEWVKILPIIIAGNLRGEQMGCGWIPEHEYFHHELMNPSLTMHAHLVYCEK